MWLAINGAREETWPLFFTCDAAQRGHRLSCYGGEVGGILPRARVDSLPTSLRGEADGVDVEKSLGYGVQYPSPSRGGWSFKMVNLRVDSVRQGCRQGMWNCEWLVTLSWYNRDTILATEDYVT